MRRLRSVALLLVLLPLVGVALVAQQSVFVGFTAVPVAVALGSQTVDGQAISTTATWNSAGTTFTHWKAVITDTASGASSKPIEIFAGAAGTTSIFSLSKAGTITGNGSLSIAGAGNIGWGGRSLMQSPSDGVMTLSNNAVTDFTRLQFGGTTSAFPSLKRNGGGLQVRLADDSAYGGIGAAKLEMGGTLLLSSTAPTVSSGFGTSPSIVNSNGTGAFTVNVGTGGTATSGVVGLPTATNGWNCWVNDLTAAAAHVAYNTRQTASTTTTATLENQTTSTGAAVAWAASDILRVSCFAY